MLKAPVLVVIDIRKYITALEELGEPAAPPCSWVLVRGHSFWLLGSQEGGIYTLETFWPRSNWL